MAQEKKKVKKDNLFDRFMIFINGIKSEIKKIKWTSGKGMVKYSVATIVFIIFCSLFFYSIDAIFALIQALFK